MLTRPHRLTASRDFSDAVRRGWRFGTKTMVLHLWIPHSGDGAGAAADSPDRPVRLGFVVGKAVGPAVTRNLVKRRLRALARDRIASLPRSSTLVVRALPPAAHASYAALGADMDRALARSRTTSTSARRSPSGTTA
ncbi:MAG TPA: ribonuclease P protein component [Nocardioidaceae bacterium]|nr:ribonuclease P protein component [Nocardioidaceae bacterium]